MAYFNGKQLNCPNCGAVITGATCEYCGSVFSNKAEIEPIKVEPSKIIPLLHGKALTPNEARKQVWLEHLNLI